MNSDIHPSVNATCSHQGNLPRTNAVPLPLDTPTARRTDTHAVTGTRAKRTRTKYSAQQLDRLEAIFEGNQYPDTGLQEDLAADMGVTMEKISIWFQNRRSKFKRESKSSHVMWMRKQIFQGGNGKALSFPYGSPRLPELTGGLCHVLSPPESAFCSRQDMLWDTSAANTSRQLLCQDPTSSLLDLRTTPKPAPTDLYMEETATIDGTTYNDNLVDFSDSVSNSRNCAIGETPNNTSYIHDSRHKFGTLPRTLQFPMATSKHHSNMTSTPNSCHLVRPTGIDFRSPCAFTDESFNVMFDNNTSFSGNDSFQGNQLTHHDSGMDIQDPAAHRKTPDTCSQRQRFTLMKNFPLTNKLRPGDNQLPLLDNQFPSTDNESHKFRLPEGKFAMPGNRFPSADNFPLVDNSSIVHFQWQ